MEDNCRENRRRIKEKREEGREMRMRDNCREEKKEGIRREKK